MTILIGSKGKGGSSPVEEDDTLFSTAYAKIIDLIGEGEIYGLVDGHKSIFFDGVPLQASDDSYNFKDCVIKTRNGTQYQTHIPAFAAVEREVPVQVKVENGTPVVRSIADTEVDLVRVTLNLPSLYKIKGSGDVVGSQVDVAIYVKASDETVFTEAVTDMIIGKSSGPFNRSYVVTLNGAGPWDIKVERLTEDSTSGKLNNDVYFATYTEIISSKLSYPNSALVGIAIDSSQFNQIPKREYLIKGLVVKVPTNYNPESRGYTGNWDGTFKLAWTDNPAWCYYDILTSTRYGLGIPQTYVDKWELYEVAQYCDELVDDGFGGTEPRFTCNLTFSEPQKAIEVIKQLASVFRAMPVWTGSSVLASQDRPRPVQARFVNANVKDGLFTYTGSALSARHTVAHIVWRDPANRYEEQVEYVEHTEAIAKHGVIETRIDAVGCTSRGMAHRVGKWLLWTEYNQTELCAFSVGMDGLLASVGEIVEIVDNDRAALSAGGRVISTELQNGSVLVTLDREIELQGGQSYTLNIIQSDGTSLSTDVLNQYGYTSTITTGLTQIPQTEDLCVWTVTPKTGESMLYRVISIAEGEGEETGEFVYSCIEHDPNKFEQVEGGMFLEGGAGAAPPAITSLPAPTGVALSEFHYEVGTAVVTAITLSCDPVQNALYHEFEYDPDGYGWVSAGITDRPSVDVRGVNPGTYKVRVRGVVGNVVGKWASITTQVTGLALPPSEYVTGVALAEPFVGEVLRVAWDAYPENCTWVVKVRNQDESLVRAVEVSEPYFEYTVEQAKYDGLGRHMVLDIHVKKNGTVALDGVRFTASNPQIGQLVNITFANYFEKAILTYDRITEADFEGVRVWASNQSGFVPSDNNVIVSSTRDAVIALPITEKTFIRIAGYDKWGDDDLAMSAELEVDSSPIENVSLIPELATAIDLLNADEFTNGSVAAAVAQEASDRAAAIAQETTNRTTAINQEATARAAALSQEALERTNSDALMQADILQLQTDVTEKASSTALNALDSRVTQTENSLSTQASDITQLQADIPEAVSYAIDQAKLQPSFPDEPPLFSSMSALSPRVVIANDWTTVYGAFEDGTDIYVNGDLVVSDLQARQTGSFQSLALGDVIESNKPISVVNTYGYNIPAVCAAGRAFGLEVRRDTSSEHALFRFYATEQDALVTLTSRTGVVQETEQYGASPCPVPAGSVVEVTVNRSTNSTLTFTVTSDAPILVFAKNTGNDDRVVPTPASREVLFSDPAGAAHWAINPAETSVYNGNGYYSGSGLIAVTDYGDGSGSDAETGIPHCMCGDTYQLPHATNNYAVVAIEPTVIKVLDADGTLYKTIDFSDASRDNPRLLTEGPQSGDQNTPNFLSAGAMFIGTGVFALRTNVLDNEYAVVGYNSHLRGELGLSGSLLNNTIKANASATAALDTRVTQTENSLTSQASDITQLQTDVAGKATNSALSALDTRVTQTENSLTSQASQITSLNSGIEERIYNAAKRWNRTYTVAPAAWAEVLWHDGNPLPTVVTELNGGHSDFILTAVNQGTAATTRTVARARYNGSAWQLEELSRDSGFSEPYFLLVNGKVCLTHIHVANTYVIEVTGEDVREAGGLGAANSYAVSALDTRVTQTENSLTSQASDITQLQTDVAGKASNSALSALDTRVTQTENSLTTQASDITQLQTDVAGKATNSALSALDTRVTQTENSLTSQASDITQLQADAGNLLAFVDDPLFTKAGEFHSFDFVGEDPSSIAGHVDISAAAKGLRVVGSKWIYTRAAYPVDTSRTYKVTFRVKQTLDPTSGGAKVYAGVATLDENFASITGGAGTHRYCTIGGPTITTAQGELVYEGTITGEGSNSNQFRPGTRYIRPMCIVNYSGGNGVAEVYELTLEDVTDAKATSDAVSALDTRVTQTENSLTSQSASLTSVESTVTGIVDSPEYLNELGLIDNYDVWDGTQNLPPTNPLYAPVLVNTGATSDRFLIAEWRTSTPYQAFSFKGKAAYGASGRYGYDCELAFNYTVGTPYNAWSRREFHTFGEKSLPVFIYYSDEGGEIVVRVYISITAWYGVHLSGHWHCSSASTLKLWQKGSALGISTPYIGTESPKWANRGIADNADVTANSSAFTGLNTRVTQAENTLTSQASDISQLQTDIAGKAASSALTALDSRVTQNETDITAQASSITQLQATRTGINLVPAEYATAHSLTVPPPMVVTANGTLDLSPGSWKPDGSAQAFTLKADGVNTAFDLTPATEDSNIAVEENTEYFLSAYVKLANTGSPLTSNNIVLTTRSVDIDGLIVGWHGATHSVGINQTVRIWSKITTGAGSVALWVRLNNKAYSGNGTAVFTADRIMLEKAVAGQTEPSDWVPGTISAVAQQKMRVDTETVKAEWSVKLNVNGQATGWGAIADQNGSHMEFLMDSTSWLDPATGNLIMGMFNGQVVINGAYVQDATIYSAAIHSLDVDKLVGNVGSFIQLNIADASIGSAQLANTIKSDNYSAANNTGWKILRSGYAEFNDIHVRGVVEGSHVLGSVIEGSLFIGEEFMTTATESDTGSGTRFLCYMDSVSYATQPVLENVWTTATDAIPSNYVAEGTTNFSGHIVANNFNRYYAANIKPRFTGLIDKVTKADMTSNKFAFTLDVKINDTVVAAINIPTTLIASNAGQSWTKKTLTYNQGGISGTFTFYGEKTTVYNQFTSQNDVYSTFWGEYNLTFSTPQPFKDTDTLSAMFTCNCYFGSTRYAPIAGFEGNLVISDDNASYK